MREIKFRFWNGTRMIQPVKWADLLIKGDGKVYCWIDIAENSGLAPANNCLPLQFTGLLDKNGVEIYESDIIRLNNGEQDFIAPVVFDQQESSFDLEHPKGYHGHWGLNIRNINACDYKVIGNIYENPELLEK